MESNKVIKKGKLSISPGDIFSVPLNSGLYGFFQFIYKDNNYMGGHLIRGFRNFSDKKDAISIPSLIKPDFYTYTRIFEGMKDHGWEKLNNLPIESAFNPPVFRQTNDSYGLVKKSNNWFIWQGDFDNKKRIGELTDNYKSLPVSMILPPSAIVEWIETGSHGFKIPE
jgi:hypothetical protein